MNLNEAIDQQRRDLGYSWGALAELVGVHENTLSNIRYARTDPRGEHIANLEKALNWPPGRYWTIRNGGTPPENTGNPLFAAIEQARNQLGLTVAVLARKVGVSTPTLYQLRLGTGNPEHYERLEKVLGWEPGRYQNILDGAPTTTPPGHPTPAPEQQLRLISALRTPAGNLTWTENSDGSRDYTLTRQIGGQERGSSIRRSSLSPEQAVEDLVVGLDIMANVHRHQTETT